MSFIRGLRTKADQVTLEADKMLRINRKRSEIGQLRKSISQLITQLGNTAYGLHNQGQTLAPELAQVCHQIDNLYADIQRMEQEIEQIRREALPTQPIASAERCHVCSAALPQAATFCPSCGSPRPKPQPTITCKNCGSSLPADASFCANCGQPVALSGPESEDVETLPPSELPKSEAILCSSCRTEIPLQATFCPVCDHPVAIPGSQLESAETGPPIEPPKAEATLCSSCQAEILLQATFCPVCGTPVDSGPSSEEMVEEETVADEDEP